MSDPLDEISRNIAQIKSSIAQAEAAAHRPKGAVTLVAVSKTQSPAHIDAGLGCGLRVFGENRVQEAQDHWAERRAAYPDLRLHLIGPLQTNKARQAVDLFDVIETLDRQKLAAALAEACQKSGKSPKILIQVNTGEEEQKAGVAPADLEALLAYARGVCGLDVAGLMCIPPVQDSPVFHFGLLATWARRLGLETLSMGMSGDFEAAIRMGATHVRVGSALFGARQAA